MVKKNFKNSYITKQILLPRFDQISNWNDFIVSKIETPRNDAGTGVLLLGDGKGNFSPLNTNESGICARGDAKKMITIQHNGKMKILIANNEDRMQCLTVE